MKLKDYLNEDLGRGDVTSEALLGNERAVGVIVAKEPCVVAGLKEAAALFGLARLRVRLRAKDGQRVRRGAVVLRVEGRARDILKVERTALNFIMRMSGIATETRRLVGVARRANKRVMVAATRKTTPGFREYEKRAVELGGGWAHRRTLSDFVLIKDNHLRLVGAIEEALKRARKAKKKVEVEVTSLRGAERAAKHGADVIMLDNMTPREARRAYIRIKAIDRGILVEVSGGITPENIRRYARWADIISLGWLTHSARARDFSLEMVEGGQ